MLEAKPRPTDEEVRDRLDPVPPSEVEKGFGWNRLRDTRPLSDRNIDLL